LIDIVIVNWNAGSQLRECVDSVLEFGGDVVARLIVIDNGSSDGSADAVEGLPGVDVLRTGKNLGFAAACNVGASKGQSPYILFLNPDTRVEPGSLSVPLSFMQAAKNAQVGICGIRLVDDDGKVSRTCARFPTPGRLVASALGLNKLLGFRDTGMLMRSWNHQQTSLVDQVIGAFFFVRRSMFEAHRGFDERFFVYFEEVDLSLRVKRAGWESWYVAQAQAFHAGGGTSRQIKARRLFYSLRSRLLYAFKHFPKWQAWLLVGLTGVIEPFTRAIWCLIRGDGVGVRNTWVAYWMLWRSMGRIVRGDGRFEP
jgi:GT2 family glycosyltransferase